MLLITFIGLLLSFLPVQQVRTGGSTLENAISDAAEAALTTRFPSRDGHFQIRVERTGGDLDGASEVRIELPRDNAIPSAHTKVDVLTVSDSGKWQKSGWALLYVSHFDSVMIAVRKLNSNDSVAPADLKATWMETTKFSGQPMSPDDLLNMPGSLFAVRLIREGQALRKTDLRPAYAAEIGQKLVMRYQRGHVAFNIACQARESGFPREVIRVYSPDTRQMYRARLVDEGTAEWIETL